MIAQGCIQNICRIIKYLWCTTWPHDEIPDTCNFFLDTSKNKPSTAAKRILRVLPNGPKTVSKALVSKRPGVSLINDKPVFFKDGNFLTFCKTVDVHLVPSATQSSTLTMADCRRQYHHISSIELMNNRCNLFVIHHGTFLSGLESITFLSWCGKSTLLLCTPSYLHTEST